MVVILVIVQTRFYHLDVPVAEFFPDKVVDLLHSNTQIVVIHIVSDHLLPDCLPWTESIYQPLSSVLRSICIRISLLSSIFIIMKREAFHTLFAKLRLASTRSHVETHIVTRCITGYQGQTQCICTVFINNLQRVNTISKRFTHLTSLRVSVPDHGSVHVWNGHFASLLITGEYHTDYPEENDIISGYQYVGRIEIIQFFGVLFGQPKC